VENKAANTGEAIVDVVHAVGENVYGLKPGDRVAAFHDGYSRR
jgi:NADPH:quinone reductase-like Zn-dependent oxidoreductase